MGKWSEQNFLKEEVQMAKKEKPHEKIFTITGHKGNAIQNHIKISLKSY
jgi:hypothetical protein